MVNYGVDCYSLTKDQKRQRRSPPLSEAEKYDVREFYKNNTPTIRSSLAELLRELDSSN